MALEKDTQIGAFGAMAPDVYFVAGSVRIEPLDSTATVTFVGFQNQAAWETAKRCRVLKAKQDAEQKAWRVRRTQWEDAHDQNAPFTEAEPFESIPEMPPFIQCEPVTVEHSDYLSMEAAAKSGQNFYALLYGVAKNPSLCTWFVGAKDV